MKPYASFNMISQKEDFANWFAENNLFERLSAPNLGRVIYIGSFKFGAEQKRICYAIYVIVMVDLFVASFFVNSV